MAAAITATRLVRALRARREIDEWIATEELVQRAVRTTGRRASRGEHQERRLGARVFSDSDEGRGAAELVLRADTDPATLPERLGRAAEEAAGAIGPAWQLPPPAAPARVELEDAELTADLAGAIDWVIAQLADGAGGRIAAAELTAELRERRVRSSHAFDRTARATWMRIDLLLAPPPGGVAEPVRIEVRRLADLDLAARLAAAAERQAARARAAPVEPGPYDLVLAPGAIALPGHGWFAPLVAQASAGWVRRGLSRYRPGQPVFARAGDADAEGAGAGFTLRSDGTIPFGAESAPFGALGEPVRRFDLVRGGVAAGLALDLREAALARRPANGGARNLVLAAGDAPAADLARPGQRPLLHASEIAWLDADPRTGHFTAELGLATLTHPDRPADPRPVAGGLLTGNLFHLLGRARLSRETGAAGWYHGPLALRLDAIGIAR